MTSKAASPPAASAAATASAGTTTTTFRFRPCIDLHQGQVKQIVGSSLTEDAKRQDDVVTNFASGEGAAHFARMYRDLGLAGGHVIMLGPGNEAEATAALQAFPGGMQVGGGLNAENAAKYVEAGASHVIVTSYVFRDGAIDMGRLEEMVRVVGKDHLVLDLSCRRRPEAGAGEAGAEAGEASGEAGGAGADAEKAAGQKKAEEDGGQSSSGGGGGGGSEASSPYYVVTNKWTKFTDFEVRWVLAQLACSCMEREEGR